MHLMSTLECSVTDQASFLRSAKEKKEKMTLLGSFSEWEPNQSQHPRPVDGYKPRIVSLGCKASLGQIKVSNSLFLGASAGGCRPHVSVAHLNPSHPLPPNPD